VRAFGSEDGPDRYPTDTRGVGAFAYLDESKTQGHHRIISVGGFVVEAGQLGEIERRWRGGKAAVGLDPEKSVKHSGDWPDREPRSRLIETIGQLPIRAVIALLEDFRPKAFQKDKSKRSELYLHKPAFEYVLQRLVTNYFGAGGGPHVVSFDLRDDFVELSKAFSRCHPRRWNLPYSTLPSLRSVGVSDSLMATDAGAANEIADFVVSAFTRWAGARCAAFTSGTPSDLTEHERAARALAPLFPADLRSSRRRGYSIVTHTQQRTGKELLGKHIDQWLDELPDDEIPF
jgi:hypothetical protein